MKRILVALAMAMSTLVFAEASFQQVETLIEQKNYQAAEMALEGIITAHPNSAKAYYAMAQAQAGLGNLGKAQFALNKARSFDPSLKFATSDNIQSLEQAITPQTKKIEVVEESHFWRNLFLILFAGAFMFIIYHFFIRKDDEGSGYAGPLGGSTPPRNPSGPSTVTPTSKVDRVNSQPLSTPAPASYTPTPSTAVNTGYAPSVTPTPTVVNNHYGSSNDGLLTGMVIGNMMSGGHHHDHHDTTIIRETVREVPPAAAPRSSWDRDDSYTPAPKTSRDSSWDDDSSSSSSSKSGSSWESPTPSRSSSWDSDSSSSSSSSWSSSSSSDSGSSWSSSDSGSSSSWD